MLRAFRDSTGTEWRVWDVVPSATSQRDAAPGALPSLAAAWADGWLCFESVTEKRRLAPIPPDWTSIAEHDLERMCAHAVVVPERRPRVRATTSVH
jgi:hypothetical protein